MLSSLDFKDIKTWENLDLSTACKRISSLENSDNPNCLPQILRVSESAYNILRDKRERARFFMNCERLGLREWKLYYAFTYLCQSDYKKFIDNVNRADSVMLENLREEEKRRVIWRPADQIKRVSRL